MKTAFALTGLAIVVLSACASSRVSEKAQLPRPAGSGSVEVRIDGVPSEDGRVYASIYLSAEGFPEDKEKAYDYRYAEATKGSITLSFAEIPAGWFAVSVLHDADNNEVLTMNFLDWPKEGYGFSLNPESTFGPPNFDKAAVYLADGEAKQLVVELID